MKKIITFIFLVFTICNIQAQTITKIASNNSPYLGEEFYYTITINNVTNISDLDYIEDILGSNLDYVGIELSPSMNLLVNWGFCIGISDTYNSTGNKELKLTFDNCNGSALGLNSFSFKVKVKLNENACAKLNHSNTAELFLKNNTSIQSNTSTVTLNTADPYSLQKAFRNYTAGYLTYDIRLNSAYGNFGMIDFANNPRFVDRFKIPSCLDLGTTPANNIDVVYVYDESTMATQTVNYNAVLNGGTLVMDWLLPNISSNNTSILYQVRIKVEDCTCVNQLFELENEAFFDGFDLCGNRIKKNDKFDIKNVSCNNQEPQIPLPLKDSICLTKTLKLDGNDLNLAMKGCTGTYTIKVENCTDRLFYKNLNLTDLVPSELDITSSPTITGNANSTVNGNNVTIQNTSTIGPNQSIEIKIPFEVNTPLPNKIIENCTSASVYGYDNIANTAFNLVRDKCAVPIVTVPNKVALHTSKTICNKPDRSCGPFSISSNVPGDTVEYALHFYNYGTVNGKYFSLEDQLPAHFEIEDVNRDVKVFKKFSGSAEDDCDKSGYKKIDRTVSKSYSNGTNKLDISFNNNELNEFTCAGVMHYLVKVKVKINNNAPNGTYYNQFVINYKDDSTQTSEFALSNQVASIVNVDNLILADKRVNANNPIVDCVNKTKTYTYTIILANMGEIPVFADIDDMIGNPSPANLLSYGSFRMCKSTGFSNGLCIPTATYIPPTLTSNSFSITGFELKPCELTVITYEAMFDINPLSKNQEVEVCNNAKIRTYTESKSNIQPVVTSNRSLIQLYLDAGSDQERVNIVDLIKEYKQNPDILSNKSVSTATNRSVNRNVIIDFGVDTFEECINLTDCLPDKTSGCFSNISSSFDFSILGMDANGNINTSLVNYSGQVTKIEYVLSDIKQIQTCEDKVFYWRGRRYILSCNGCSTNTVGKFTTTNISPINGTLNFNMIPQLNIPGSYKEYNKVAFSGVPTTLVQDNRTFKFPVNVNCNGSFEFTITAIVHFKDCSVCYVTDVFDYNASFRWVNPYPRTSILVGPRRIFTQ